MSYYPVHLIEYLGAPRKHHAISMETREDEQGLSKVICTHLTSSRSISLGTTFDFVSEDLPQSGLTITRLRPLTLPPTLPQM